MMDFAGVDLALKCQPTAPPRIGRSLLGILERSDVVDEAHWQHHVFGSHTYHQRENYWPTRVIRTRRYKYHRNIAWRLDFPFSTDMYASLSWEGIRNSQTPVSIGSRSLRDYTFRPAEQLFDLQEDPGEVRDLASGPEHGAVIQELRGKLEQWQQRTQDTWLRRDGQSLEDIKFWVVGGLSVPDRFDVDVEQPGTRVGVKMLRADAPIQGISRECDRMVDADT